MRLSTSTEAARRARWELPCAAALVLLAAWLRLRHLGLAEFKSDEAIAIRIGRDILHGDLRTTGLTSSSGAANPPLYVYVVAAVLGVRDDPLFATAFVAVAATLAVALTYVVVRRRFGAAVALICVGLFATAPWAVLYGRHLWQQDLLPLVCVGLLWSLFHVLERPHSRLVLLVPVLVSTAIQLNLSAVALAIPSALVLAHRPRAVRLRALAGGVALGILLLGPWLAHNAKHGFRDFSAIAEHGRGHGGSAAGTGLVEAVRQTVHLASAGGWDFVVGASRGALAHEAGAAWTLGRAAGVVVVALLVAGMATSAVVVARGARRIERWPLVALDADGERRALLLLWLVGIWLSYVSSSADGVGPHYLIVGYPVSFVFAALGLTDLAAAAGRGPVAALAPLAAGAVLVAGFAAFTLSFQRFVQRHGGTAGDYGVVYDDRAALADAVRARGLHVDDPVAEFLVRGKLAPPDGVTAQVRARDRLVDRTPLRCGGAVRSFGPLEACFPP